MRHREGQGRPMGAVGLWLFWSDVVTREEHQALKKWVCARAQQGERAFHRSRLHDCIACAELFDDVERQKRDDTDSEPEIIPL